LRKDGGIISDSERKGKGKGKGKVKGREKSREYLSIID
jgi:hypothetical protein